MINPKSTLKVNLSTKTTTLIVEIKPAHNLESAKQVVTDLEIIQSKGFSNLKIKNDGCFTELMGSRPSTESELSQAKKELNKTYLDYFNKQLIHEEKALARLKKSSSTHAIHYKHISDQEDKIEDMKSYKTIEEKINFFKKYTSFGNLHVAFIPVEE